MPPGPSLLSLRLVESELVGLQRLPQGLLLELAAADVVWADPQGRRLQGFATGVTLCFSGLEHVEQEGEPLGRVTHASMQIDGRRVEALPLPGRCVGAISLELVQSDRFTLHLRATAVAAQLAPDARWRESMAC